jgi:hypothetical protein
MKAAYAKIFPTIGISRVGDSETDWFIGPEWPGQRLSADPFHRYKDDAGRVKRQAARFRIYAFDEHDGVVGELCASNAEITWSVELANKKPAWLPFDSGPEALKLFELSVKLGGGDELIRQAGVRGLVPRNPSVGLGQDEQGKPRWDPEARRALLEIIAPKATIAGKPPQPDAAPVELAGSFNGETVKLGEITTDSEGRLVTLGAFGRSKATGLNGADTWIRDYANNDGWFDDVSDGPVTATVRVDGTDIPVRGVAWLIVTPPDFAPDTDNLVTAWEAMCETVLHHKVPVPKELAIRQYDKVEFWRDIYPILERLARYSWVSGLGLRGHGYAKNGSMTGERLALLADPNDPAGRAARAGIGKIIRKPLRWHTNDNPSSDDIELAVAQANLSFMPPLSGDEGDVTNGDPMTWLTVTPTQYALLQRWAANDFTTGAKPADIDQSGSWENRWPPKERPLALTRGVLARCVGGAFYPGIEITSILKSPKFYLEAFRINPTAVHAGDVTKWMACPWQADFWECQLHWWPAQRPDDVVRAADFDSAMKKFPVETKEGRLPSMLFPRSTWARGVGTGRPSLDGLTNALIADPSVVEEADSRIAGKGAKSFAETVASRITTVWRSQVFPTPTYPQFRRGGDPEPLYPDRIPSPWRMQYLLQEATDTFSGLFFFQVPTPEAVLKNCPKRETWKEHCRRDPIQAAKELKEYRAGVIDRFNEKVTRLIVQALGQDASSAHLAAILKMAAPPDRDPTEEEQHSLACAELVLATADAWYLFKSNWGGDVDMVSHWKRNGFVVERSVSTAPGAVSVLVETERSEFDGLSWGERFYLLQNPAEVRDYAGLCEFVTKTVLDSADELVQVISDSSAGFVEAPFPYTDELFDSKLEEIYEIYRVKAQNPRPWERDATRDEISRGILRLAPFNQMDGAWLRFVEDAGETDSVHGLLFQIWRDEVGNGKPSEHHGNLYTTLLRSLGFDLPDVATRAYIDSYPFTDDNFTSPAFELAISARSKDYFPEILGMTLFLEWEVLELSPGVPRWEYFGIDPKFLRMHVGIDNAADGHGAKTKEAVKRYLTDIAIKGGNEAVQAHWARIWRGFVAFAAPMHNYLPDELGVMFRRPPNVEDRLKLLINKKRPYANRNHLDRRLGTNRLNDLFEYPDVLLPELATSNHVVPGHPEDSRFLAYLTTYDGPMYKVFNEDELKLWSDWIVWLGREGDTPRPKRVFSRAQAMLRLLELMRSGGLGSVGHERMRIGGRTLREWFGEADLTKLMDALRKDQSGWVVRGNAAASGLVVDHLRVDRPMGRALDRRFVELQGRVGRVVIVDWINGGCLLPGEAAPAAALATRPPGTLARAKLLLVHEFGQGAVH